MVADALGCAPKHVLVASTGVIGEPLAMEAVKRGVGLAFGRLADGSRAGLDAAEAIMTTDRVVKTSGYAYFAGARRFVIGGFAKGSGMIAPDLATMLAFVGTNAAVGSSALQAALSTACEESFNMISVDGAMSTNDVAYALARPHPDPSFLPDGFAEGLARVCHDLALAIARDGEGATKLLQVRVGGAASRSQARAMAKAIVNCNLVKSALFGEDPNWGRIVAAAGAAKAGFPSSGWTISLNGTDWIRDGCELLAAEQAHRRLAVHDISIDVALELGSEDATGWGCDLTSEYVKINAHYRS
jgi:glutamate N-acetyltransferase/amino-acid N-acetyltransferase